MKNSRTVLTLVASLVVGMLLALAPAARAADTRPYLSIAVSLANLDQTTKQASVGAIVADGSGHVLAGVPLSFVQGSTTRFATTSANGTVTFNWTVVDSGAITVSYDGSPFPGSTTGYQPYAARGECCYLMGGTGTVTSTQGGGTGPVAPTISRYSVPAHVAARRVATLVWNLTVPTTEESITEGTAVLYDGKKAIGRFHIAADTAAAQIVTYHHRFGRGIHRVQVRYLAPSGQVISTGPVSKVVAR